MSPVASVLFHPYLLLGLAVLLSFFSGLLGAPLFDLDEGAFSEATREMFQRGDFISTYLNGVPRYDKPILIYWLQALTTTLFGFNEFGFRLPSALAGTGWVLAVYWFMRRMRDQRTALMAALMVALSVSVSVIAKAATADALLNMLLAMSMMCLFLYLQERDKKWLMAVYVLAGLGFLTKGPVAVFIPVMVSGIYCLVQKDLRFWFLSLLNPWGIAIFLLIAAPWYILQYQAEGQAFIDGFFLKHNVDRFQGPMEQHGGSIFYYIPVVLVGVLPFTTSALRVFRRPTELFGNDLTLYAAIWFLFVLVFFSLSGTKLPHYVNYGLTGLFILSSIFLPRLQSALLALLPPLLMFFLLLLVPELIDSQLAGIKDPVIADALAAWPEAFGWDYRAFMVLAMVVMLVLIIERRLRIPEKLVIAGVLLVVALSGMLLPRVGELIQAPVREAALLARERGLQVSMWRINMPSFSVYRQDITPRLEEIQPGQVIFTKKQYLADIPAFHPLLVKGGIALIRVN